MSQQQHQKLKQEYGWFYDALCQLLAEDDPMYLIAGGAPNNEYDIEVDGILLRLPEASSPAILGHIMYETFDKCFGSTFARPDQPPSEQAKRRFGSLGERAWALWMRWKEEA